MPKITVLDSASMDLAFNRYKSVCHGTPSHIVKTLKLLTAFNNLALKRFDRTKNSLPPSNIDLWKKLSNRKPYKKSYAGTSGVNIKAAFRAFLEIEQGNRCCYCQRWLINIGHAKPIEHILPRETFSQYTFNFWNLAVACFDCNLEKGAKIWANPSKNGMRHYPAPSSFSEMYHPRFHKFDEHVRFLRIQTNEQSISVYTGITEQGKKLCTDLLRHISSKEILINGNHHLKFSLDVISSYEVDPQSSLAEALDAFNVAFSDIAMKLINK
ncbi:hypothetical protein D3C73_280480 [compost metagenome]